MPKISSQAPHPSPSPGANLKILLGPPPVDQAGSVTLELASRIGEARALPSPLEWVVRRVLLVLLLMRRRVLLVLWLLLLLLLLLL